MVGGEAGYPDLIVHPDLSTMVTLPWEAGVACCLSNLEPARPDTPVCDPRGALARAVAIRPGILLLGREIRVLDQQRSRVDPHAGDAALEPEPQDVLVLGPDFRTLPVEVGLLGREQVEVPLARRPVRVRRPGQVSPEKLETHSVGFWSPFSPLPGWNQNRCLAGDPAGAASASWNQTCWSEK